MNNQKNIIKVLIVLLIIALGITVTINGKSDKASTDTLLTTVDMNDQETKESNNEKTFTVTASDKVRSYSTSNETRDTMVENQDLEVVTAINSELAYEMISNDFKALQTSDEETVTKYFGLSDTFTSETIGDRTSASKLTCMSFEENNDGTYTVNTHICTLDYNKMNEDFLSELANKNEEEAKRIIADNLLNSKYEVHYNVPITIKDGEILISESFKQAITGNWYTGVGITLNPVDCELK